MVRVEDRRRRRRARGRAGAGGGHDRRSRARAVHAGRLHRGAAGGDRAAVAVARRCCRTPTRPATSRRSWRRALDRALITDVTGDEDAGGSGPAFVRPMFQGKLTADVVPQGPTPHFVTFQIGAFRADQAARGRVAGAGARARR